MLKQKLIEKTKRFLEISKTIGIVLSVLCFTVGVCFTGVFGVMIYEKTSQFIADPINQRMIAEVLIPSVNAEPTMREYVKAEIEKAGLNWELVDCIIHKESNWNNWAYGINTDGSTDFGLWQINSQHKATASVECRWSYKCSTKWAIEKRLRDGSWLAWYGIAKCN